MYLFSISKQDRKRGFFSKLIFYITLLVMAATEANAVSYTGFNDKTYELTPWEGENVVVLTQSNALDVSTMRNIVENLDGAWDVYADLTGRSPTPWPATTLNDRSTIAELPDGETCGAGCAYLGFTGIEIASTYWNILYDGVIGANEYDQVLFYELGRNYWLYSEQLGKIEPFATGFAIANRFVSMNEIDVAGGPFGSLTFDEFKRLATEELFAAYLADPSLDWRNTLAANSGVPGQEFSDAPSLAGAMLYQIYKDHGYAGYRAFWRELNEQPHATTSEDAMVNFIYAAYLGTGQDYRPLMKADDLPAPVPPTRIETLWIPIAIGPDDAEENLNDGDVSLTSSDLELIQDGLKPQLVGLRFSLDIPAGATILTANIQFTADEISSVPTDLSVSAEATPHAFTFEDLDSNISNRPLTVASVQWSPSEWLIKGEAGPNQATPDLSTIVQEIVNQNAWEQGNSIAFIISGNGMREAESFDGTAAPVLHITYSNESEDLYAIGDTGPGGGIVFYTSNGGMNGLEVTPVNQGQANWGCFYRTLPPAIITGATGTAVGTGAQNTADILAACNEPGIAAEIADMYELNGVSDWFLPSANEALLMHEQHILLDLNANFWTSTENSAYSAFYLRLSQGDTRTGNKEVFFDVWPIRAF